MAAIPLRGTLAAYLAGDNFETHRGAFAVPNFVQRALKGKSKG